MIASKTVLYIDFGYTSARQYWVENVMPAYDKFQAQPNGATAIDASIPAWHVHDWIWHEQHPGEDTQHNPGYKKFQKDLINDCSELAWIRDVADAGKHRGLGRKNAEVRRVATQTRMIRRTGGPNQVVRRIIWVTPLTVTLSDGSTLGFADVLSRVIDYRRTKHFP
jgi:hypothetical protein